MDKQFDLVIAGAGLAGLALAVAVKDAAPATRIAVCDPFLGILRKSLRTSAIAAGPRRMLDRIGVWAAIVDDAQPMREMIITDSRRTDAIRPAFLTFEGEAAPGEPFAHMVFNASLEDALEARARALGVECIKAAVRDIAPEDHSATLSDGSTIFAGLTVAADGRDSRLRRLAGISTSGWSYKRSAIVATIGHERDHEGRAWEHFLPSGPFAMLPLTGRRSSIVWTEPTKEAAYLVSLPPDLFIEELEARFGQELGELHALDKPQAFPLELQIARSFVGDRLALIGDAAHAVHPISGQGINLGFRDVAVLAELVVAELRLGLDPGSQRMLEAYQRARRFDTLTMVAATDSLHRLFSNDVLPLRLARDLGLGLVDRAPALKNFFIREAAGLVGAAPRLIRGEAL